MIAKIYYNNQNIRFWATVEFFLTWQCYKKNCNYNFFMFKNYDYLDLFINERAWTQKKYN